jgi:hypothetical protein
LFRVRLESVVNAGRSLQVFGGGAENFRAFLRVADELVAAKTKHSTHGAISVPVIKVLVLRAGEPRSAHLALGHPAHLFGALGRQRISPRPAYGAVALLASWTQAVLGCRR